MEMSKESILEKNREHIVWLFKGRCLICNLLYTDVHEIEPKSRRPNNWWEIDNMVLLCRTCHSWAHQQGMSAKSIETMKTMRQARVKVLYGDNPPELDAP
jgi:5-methylcytosine-specific restriction endonuclease McrA